MDDHELKSIIQAALEKEIPAAEIELWPTGKQRLAARKHPLFQQGASMSTQQPRRSMRLALTVLVLFVLLAITFATPPGRALAQNIVHFFTRAGSDVLPGQPADVAVAEAPRTLSIAEAENQSGFELWTAANLPLGLSFQGASYTPELHTVIQQYGYAPEDIRLSVKQQAFSNRESCDLCGLMGASASAQAVQIAGVPGEYVEGVWQLTENGPVWQNTPYLKTLRWQRDGMAFELIFMGEELALPDLLAIAESLAP